MIESPAGAFDDHRPAGSPPSPGQELGPFAGPTGGRYRRRPRRRPRSTQVELKPFDVRAPFSAARLLSGGADPAAGPARGGLPTRRPVRRPASG